MATQSLLLAGAGTAGYLALYVLPLHLVPGPRDAPMVIKYRLAVTALSSTLLTLGPPFMALAWRNRQAPGWHELASMLGLTAHGSAGAAFFGVAQASVLFAGPLVLHALDALERSKHRTIANPFFADRTKLQILRDLVLAPLSEELVFRASLPVFLMTMCPGLNKPASFALSIVAFSAAHCHHVFELLRHGGYGLRTALGATAFQALYTGVFGAYASLLLHRTRNIMAPVAAHTFCNWQGIPAFDRLARHRRSTMLWFVTGLGVAGWATLVARQVSTMASTA